MSLHRDEGVLEQLSSRDSATAIVELGGRVNTLGAEMKGKIDGLSNTIQMHAEAQLQVQQTFKGVFESIEARLREQSQALRDLHSLPEKVVRLETQLKDLEGHVDSLEIDRGKVLGFMVGAALFGGGVGGAIVGLFGG